MDWKKLLCPRWYLIVLFVFISAVGLWFSFTHGMENSVLAYILYPFSFYSLVVCVIGLWDFWKKYFWPFLDRIPFFHNMVYDVKIRTMFFTRFSVVFNTLYGLLQVFYGLCYHTLWFITLGVYYILLIMIRMGLLRKVQTHEIGNNLKFEYKKYLHTGVMLLFMNLIVTGIVTLMFQEGRTFEYPGVLIYAIAAYAFYSLGLAIYGMISYKKYNSPVLSATRSVNFAGAMISILSLEIALLHQFGTNDPALFADHMVGITGFCMAIILTVMGVYMIAKGKKQLELLK
ncbi:MAG: hypothetical protein K6E64_06190 [Lachnospiraceae bacterium]|nr:hypothetical protein [Lachnospiraceae bacterium]